MKQFRFNSISSQQLYNLDLIVMHWLTHELKHTSDIRHNMWTNIHRKTILRSGEIQSCRLGSVLVSVGSNRGHTSSVTVAVAPARIILQMLLKTHKILTFLMTFLNRYKTSPCFNKSRTTTTSKPLGSLFPLVLRRLLHSSRPRGRGAQRADKCVGIIVVFVAKRYIGIILGSPLKKSLWNC